MALASTERAAERAVKLAAAAAWTGPTRQRERHAKQRVAPGPRVLRLIRGGVCFRPGDRRIRRLFSLLAAKKAEEM